MSKFDGQIAWLGTVAEVDLQRDERGVPIVGVAPLVCPGQAARHPAKRSGRADKLSPLYRRVVTLIS